jgi:hypothetical protein
VTVPDWAGYLYFRDAFRDAIDERYYPMEWLDERLLTGRAVFMRSAHAAIVVELRQFPGGAMDVHGLIAAGDKNEIITDLIPHAEEWGRENGCLAGVVESRPGWAKALKPYGYTVSQVTVRKEL